MSINDEIKKLELKQIIKLCRMYPNIFIGYKNVVYRKLRSFVLTRINRKDIFHVGDGDKFTFDDVSFEQLDMGIAVEYEHTSNLYESIDIAFDHLAELPDYYTRLASMERQGKRYWKGKSKRKYVDSEHDKMLRNLK